MPRKTISSNSHGPRRTACAFCLALGLAAVPQRLHAQRPLPRHNALQSPSPPLAPPTNATAAVGALFDRLHHDDQSLEHYTWRQTWTQDHLNHGRVTRTETDVFQASMVDDHEYDIPVSKNGVPVSSAKRAKQFEKIAKLLQKRAARSPRERREANARDARRHEEMRSDLLNGFRFTFMGLTNGPDGPAWRIDAQPVPGYRFQTSEARRLFPHLAGSFFINVHSGRLDLIQLHSFDTVRFGLILGSLSPGAQLRIRLGPGPTGAWVIRKVTMAFSARVLWSHQQLRATLQTADYKRYRVEVAGERALK